jgi:murein L,D-transpeptidase YafK
VLNHYGRGSWVPLHAKLTGGQTTDSVVSRLTATGDVSIPRDIKHYDALTLIGLKEARRLEVWAHRKGQNPELITSYPFTGYSGKIGPKLREGDLQIPEGVYQIEYLNPNSSFHLSMKINYPNAFDKRMGAADGRTNLGYDIFIHGKSSTVGCIPIGDRAIEELFALVATIGVEKVKVILSPYDMRTGIKNLSIKNIDWEDELYQQIRTALTPYQ